MGRGLMVDDTLKNLFQDVYSWIGRQIRADKKSIANEPEGLRHFRDHRWKALDEENPNLLCIFFL